MILQNIILVIIELFYCSIDVMLLHYFCSILMTKKKKNMFVEISIYCIAVIGVFLLTYGTLFSKSGNLLSFLIMLLYAYIIFEKASRGAFIMVSFYYICSGIVTLLTASVVPMILDTSISSIMSNPLFRSLIVLFTKLLILLIGFFCRNKFSLYSDNTINLRGVLIFFVIVFVNLTFVFEFVYLSEEIPLENLVLTMIFTFIIFIVLIAILMMKYIDEKEKTINFEIKLEEANRKNEEHIKSASDQVEIMRVKHDLKNHLVVLDSFIRQNGIEDAKKYLHKLFVHPGLKSYVNTKNMIINAVMNQKIAEYPNIRFKVRHDDNFYNISDTALTIILGNALDNAIEAVKFMNSPEVKVVFSENENYIKLYIENPFSIQPIIRRGKIITQKDSRFSGIGINNILQASKSVGGEAIFKVESNVFKLVVLVDKHFNQ